tara:strand:+ start:60 stop:764 length:705 start_codon:yes stop_codon:yes gene_type:complete
MKNLNYYNNSVEAGYYDKVYKKNKGIQSAWHHIKFKYIKKKIIKSKSHLDIGCGPGTFLGMLNKKAIGIDIAKNQINYAKKNYTDKKLKFLVYKNKIPLKSKSVDTISLIELIEHIDDEDVNFLLKECRRVLKKDGELYLSTPNYHSLWPLLEIVLNLISPVDYKHEHINKFNKKKLKKTLQKNGFKILELNSFILCAPFLAPFSFKISMLMINLENLITKFFPGFLLFLKAKK